MGIISKWEISPPRVIAHRGASAYAPENTMSAFHMAESLGADAIELDVKLLRDGNVIVLHDKTLDRTTNGKGSVYRYILEEILEFDAGSHFSEDFKGESIPTLELVLKELGEKLLINIELTNYHRPWDRLPHAVIRLVKEYHLEERILLSSFNPWALVRAKKAEPGIARALLLGKGTPKEVRSLFMSLVDVNIIHPQFQLLSSKGQVDRFSDYRQVNVWTVNDQQAISESIGMGVTGIITDYPDIAREAWIKHES
jgi:glycerophosphoryl diester phosphodiesterase